MDFDSSRQHVNVLISPRDIILEKIYIHPMMIHLQSRSQYKNENYEHIVKFDNL